MNKNDKTTAYDSDAPLWYGITKFERATSAEVERHIPIVRKMIELYGYGDALSYDEKFAAGLVGVAIAIERFDASRGVKYAYWLSFQIDKAIRNESRLVRRQRRRAVQPFDEDFDPIDERDWEDRSTRDDREERNARIDRVCAALKSLDERSQFVLSELHIEGKTQTEVARELGVYLCLVAREQYFCLLVGVDTGKPRANIRVRQLEIFYERVGVDPFVNARHLTVAGHIVRACRDNVAVLGVFIPVVFVLRE